VILLYTKGRYSTKQYWLAIRDRSRNRISDSEMEFCTYILGVQVYTMNIS
jgi:hypothetical protein